MNPKLGIPSTAEKKLSVMQSRHDGLTAGHFGFRKTLDLIARDYQWPNMHNDVKNFIDSCEICARVKHSRKQPFGLLQPVQTPQRPWAHISINFITDLSISNGFDSILVIVDYFTKMSHFLPTHKTCTSSQLEELFIPNIFRLHGIPDKIVSDRGPKLVAHFLKRFCELCNMKLALSTAYHPQTDGQTERCNQTLETILRCYINFKQNNWHSILPLA